MGSPAKVKEQLSDDKLAYIMAGNQAYVQLAQEYREHGLDDPELK
jgi:carbonic anhydrase/acetyltransferase-like protein (isoleucine patch superfamily)